VVVGNPLPAKVRLTGLDDEQRIEESISGQPVIPLIAGAEATENAK
jgi:hypothetical protein